MSIVTQGIRDLVKKAISDNTVMVNYYEMKSFGTWLLIFD
jgi:hypothetical protein